MALPANWTLIAVTGTYTNLDGTPASGYVTFESNQRIVIGGQLVVPAIIRMDLDGTGSISGFLPATNDPDLSVTGWGYTVTENIPNGRPRFVIEAPYSGGPINLITVPTAQPVIQTPVSSALHTTDIGVTVASQASVQGLGNLVATGTGLLVHTATDNWAVRSVNTLSPTALTVTNGNGISGDIEITVDATLVALAGQNWAANTIAIGSGADTALQLAIAANTFPARSSAGNVAAKSISDFGLTLVAAADAAASRTVLGLGSGDSPTFTGVTTTGAATIGGAATFNGTLAVNGALTINTTTVTISANYTATRALGAAAAGNTTPQQWSTTFSGDAGGATEVYAGKWLIASSGTNAMAAIRNMYLGTEVITTAGATTVASGTHAYVWLKDAGTVTHARVVEGHIRVDGSGGITGTAYVFNVVGVTLNGTGAITQLVGYACGNIGHATLVSAAYGFFCDDITGASTTTAAFRCDVSSGTNKWNLYVTGTADNFIEGRVRWGTTAIAANNGQVVSVTNVGPGGAGLSIQEWVKCMGTGGATRYLPLFG